MMKLLMYGIRLRRVARQQFGWPSLRPGQFKPMRAVLRRRDALVVLPTGAGKSAIYQIPAVLLPGPTVVISPLLALQQDQIAALNERGDPKIRAVRVSSAESPHQQREAIREIREGRAEFLFITPEQLSNPERLAEVRDLRPGLVAVDEAHCISGTRRCPYPWSNAMLFSKLPDRKKGKPVTDEPLYSTWGFTDSEWGLLVGLPQAVSTAASAVTPDNARKTRAENEAGLEKISAARGSASPLVAGVANAALSRTGDPELGEEAPVIEPADPIGYAQDVLERAAEVSALLTAKAQQSDAETYKHWLVEIADTVVGAASTGGLLGLGGETVTDSERSFRDDLAKNLAD